MNPKIILNKDGIRNLLPILERLSESLKDAHKHLMDDKTYSKVPDIVLAEELDSYVEDLKERQPALLPKGVFLLKLENSLSASNVETTDSVRNQLINSFDAAFPPEPEINFP